MIIQYDPQCNEDDTLVYSFEKDKIIATLNGVTDEFDFSGLPDGEAVRNEETGFPDIETILPVILVREVKKVDGVLYVKLLKYHTNDAPYEERYPQPFEVEVN